MCFVLFCLFFIFWNQGLSCLKLVFLLNLLGAGVIDEHCDTWFVLPALFSYKGQGMCFLCISALACFSEAEQQTFYWLMVIDTLNIPRN